MPTGQSALVAHVFPQLGVSEETHTSGEHTDRPSVSVWQMHEIELEGQMRVPLQEFGQVPSQLHESGLNVCPLEQAVVMPAWQLPLQYAAPPAQVPGHCVELPLHTNPPCPLQSCPLGAGLQWPLVAALQRPQPPSQAPSQQMQLPPVHGPAPAAVLTQ